MATAIADLSRWYCSTAFETTIGTGVTATASFYLKSNLSPKHKDEIDDMVNGTILPSRVTRVMRETSGSISGPLCATLLAPLMKFVTGTVPTNGGAGDPYTHTITDAFVAPSTFTVVKQIAGASGYILKYGGILAKTLKISATSNAKVMFDLALQGNGALTTTTEPVVALPAENYFTAIKTTLTVGSVDVSKYLRSWSLTIDPKTEVTPRAGSTDGTGVSVDRTGRLDIKFDYTLDEGVASVSAYATAGGLSDYEAQTQRAIVLTIAGDTNRSASFTMPVTQQIGEYQVDIGQHGVYGIQRKAQVLVKSDGTYFTSVVTNGVAAYA